MAKKGICIVAILLFILRVAYADEQQCHIIWTASAPSIPVSIDAILESAVPETLPEYTAQLQSWQSESIELFLQFNLRQEEAITDIVDLGDGTAYVFNRATYESMVFLHDVNASWRYMNGRAEVCYNNMLEGQYVMYTFSLFSTDDAIDFLSQFGSAANGAVESLEKLGIQVGLPFEMIAYYPYQDGIESYICETPDFIEVSFYRLFNGFPLSPRNQPMLNAAYTPRSCITMYIDGDGVSNILVPLVFEDCINLGEKKVLNIDQAIEALNSFLSSIILPPTSSKVIIDHIALEYIPIPTNSGYCSFHLVPAWSFYANHDDDATRELIAINAYTGEPITIY